jgi:hypothetical protein
MGKAMVNATNLVAHATIVAHLNLKLTMTKVACHGPVVAFVINLTVVVLPCGIL